MLKFRCCRAPRLPLASGRHDCEALDQQQDKGASHSNKLKRGVDVDLKCLESCFERTGFILQPFEHRLPRKRIFSFVQTPSLSFPSSWICRGTQVSPADMQIRWPALVERPHREPVQIAVHQRLRGEEGQNDDAGDSWKVRAIVSISFEI